jgi:hypothetical protein
MLAKTDGADVVIAKTQNIDMFFTELLERYRPNFLSGSLVCCHHFHHSRLTVRQCPRGQQAQLEEARAPSI